MKKHKLNIVFLVSAMVTTAILFWTDENLLTILFSVFLAFFLILSAGVVFLRFNYFLKSTCNTDKPYVMLTFDDGPDPQMTPKILDTLSKFGVKAIFFVVGKKAENNPKIIARIIEDGHFIGNHTYSHPPIFAMMSGEKVKKELEQFNAVLQNSKVETKFFRPPIGYTNPIIARVVNEMNLKVIGWNKRSYDTVFRNEKRLSGRLLSQAKNGNIILLHDNLKQTEAALPLFLNAATEKGIIFANEEDIKTFVNETF